MPFFRFFPLFIASSVVTAGVAIAGCTSILGGFDIAALETDGGSEGGSNGGQGKESGAACQSGTECASSFCADGVCCESACDGVCESCALGTPGTCLPIPDGTDPGLECGPVPLADAGAGGGGVEGADGGDAGDLDAGKQVNVPDGGTTADQAACAGSCNGARACKFPGQEKACGTKFCNTSSEAARVACDGQGHCGALAFETCDAFTCEVDDCLRSCTGLDDCQSTHFCNSSGVCQPKLGNGIPAVAGTQCQSGFVSDGVCCNTDCSTVPSGKCNNKGSEGTCSCRVDGENCTRCLVYYPDTDGDRFGDATATLANGRAVAGCESAPPAGYVGNRADCADGDANAHPGQTEFFEKAIVGARAPGTEAFDFDCGGTTDKETAEYVGASCHACGTPERKACSNDLGCPFKLNVPAYLNCAYGLDGREETCVGKGAAKEGFGSSVACGSTGTYLQCGSCNVGVPGVRTSTVAQRCR